MADEFDRLKRGQRLSASEYNRLVSAVERLQQSHAVGDGNSLSASNLAGVPLLVEHGMKPVWLRVTGNEGGGYYPWEEVIWLDNAWVTSGQLIPAQSGFFSTGNLPAKEVNSRTDVSLNSVHRGLLAHDESVVLFAAGGGGGGGGSVVNQYTTIVNNAGDLYQVTYNTNNQIINITYIGCFPECERIRPPCTDPCTFCESADGGSPSFWRIRLFSLPNSPFAEIDGVHDLEHQGGCVWAKVVGIYRLEFERFEYFLQVRIYRLENGVATIVATYETNTSLDCCEPHTLLLVDGFIGAPPIVSVEPGDECVSCEPPPLDCETNDCSHCPETFPLIYTAVFDSFGPSPYDGYNGRRDLAYTSACEWLWESGTLRITYTRGSSSGVVEFWENVASVWTSRATYTVDTALYPDCCGVQFATATTIAAAITSSPSAVALSPIGECVSCPDTPPVDPCDWPCAGRCGNIDRERPVARKWDFAFTGWRNTSPVGIDVESLNRRFTVSAAVNEAALDTCNAWWEYEDATWLIRLIRQGANTSVLSPDICPESGFVYYILAITHKPSNYEITSYGNSGGVFGRSFPPYNASSPNAGLDACTQFVGDVRVNSRHPYPGFTDSFLPYHEAITFTPRDCVTCDQPDYPPPDPCATYTAGSMLSLHLNSTIDCIDGLDVVLTGVGDPVEWTHTVDCGGGCSITIDVKCESGELKVRLSGTDDVACGYGCDVDYKGPDVDDNTWLYDCDDGYLVITIGGTKCLEVTPIPQPDGHTGPYYVSVPDAPIERFSWRVVNFADHVEWYVTYLGNDIFGPISQGSISTVGLELLPSALCAPTCEQTLDVAGWSGCESAPADMTGYLAFDDWPGEPAGCADVLEIPLGACVDVTNLVNTGTPVRVDVLDCGFIPQPSDPVNYWIDFDVEVTVDNIAEEMTILVNYTSLHEDESSTGGNGALSAVVPFSAICASPFRVEARMLAVGEVSFPPWRATDPAYTPGQEVGTLVIRGTI